MKNYKEKGLGFRLIKIFVLLSCLYAIPYTLYPKTVSAQAINLSITPPLFEVMIAPGKEIKQVFTITNDGGDVILIPKILYFIPDSTDGTVELTDEVAPDWVKFNQDAFSLKNGNRTDFTVTINPPEGTEETDHFLTLIIETTVPTDVLGQASTFYKTIIGSNILVTVSKDGNPKKSAEIIEFTAPKLIDSFLNPIPYTLVLRNNGNSFWKPNGKIISGDETLKLANLNILSGSNRNLLCLKDENLDECKATHNIFLGKITHKLEFQMDDDTKIYKAETVTYVFPFMLVAILIFLLTTFRYRRIFKLPILKK